MALSTDYRVSSKSDLARHAAIFLFGATGVAALVYLVLAGLPRAAFAFAVTAALLTLAAVRVRLALVATLVFLVLLGDLRRMLIPVAGWSGTDPLLVVGPAIAIALTGNALVRGEIPADSWASRCMIVLMAIMLIQVFNPRQGALIVGVAGVMFQFVPLLWFWLGKAYGTRPFLQTLLFRVVLGLSGLAMLFGLYQSVFGYLPYQFQWYQIAGYPSLGNPERGLSPITFFASNTEHAIFVSLGIVLLWSLYLFKNRSALLPIPVFLGALLVTGVRGPVAKILIMMSGLWAIKGQTVVSWFTRGALALGVAALGLFWSLSGITQSLDDAPPQVQNRLERQANEFVRVPTGEQEYSSASTHLGMLVHGYRLSLQYPLGVGLGAGTKAAMKFRGGGDTGSDRGDSSPALGSTETDFGDTLRALGIPGGLVYHVLVFLLVLNAFRLWNQDRRPLHMALLGFMGITFLGWLSGGRYGVTPLLWFCLGAVDRLYQKESPPQRD